MEIAIYAFTGNGAKLCDRIIENLKEDNIEAFVPERCLNSARYVQLKKGNLYKSTEKSFKTKDAIIFIGAVGIAVRAIAPCIRTKAKDPSVICMDEKGKNVISLLSGHIGGANKLTRKIAEIVGGQPVITTATDINNKFAVDQWAVNNNLHIMSLKTARDIAAEILKGERIGFCSDFEIIGQIPDEISYNEKKLGICISLNGNKKPFTSTLNLIPKIVSVGIGCKKSTNFKVIFGAIKEVLKDNYIHHFAVKSLNSIDLKKNEEGIRKTAEILNVPFNTYTKDELYNIEGEFTESDFVKKITGIGNVCERAAVRGSNSKRLVIKKTVYNSVTVAAAIDDYQVNFKNR